MTTEVNPRKRVLEGIESSAAVGSSPSTAHLVAVSASHQPSLAMATPARQRSSTLTRRPSLPTAILPKIPRNLSNSLDSKELLRLVNHLSSLYATTAPAQSPTDAAYSAEVDELEIDPLGPDSQVGSFPPLPAAVQLH